MNPVLVDEVLISFPVVLSVVALVLVLKQAYP